MRRRMAVVGEEDGDITGEEGLAETSWDTMREYAYKNVITQAIVSRWAMRTFATPSTEPVTVKTRS